MVDSGELFTADNLINRCIIGGQNDVEYARNLVERLISKEGFSWNIPIDVNRIDFGSHKFGLVINGSKRIRLIKAEEFDDILDSLSDDINRRGIYIDILKKAGIKDSNFSSDKSKEKVMLRPNEQILQNIRSIK